jgi:hypothetical protein
VLGDGGARRPVGDSVQVAILPATGNSAPGPDGAPPPNLAGSSGPRQRLPGRPVTDIGRCGARFGAREAHVTGLVRKGRTDGTSRPEHEACSRTLILELIHMQFI